MNKNLFTKVLAVLVAFSMLASGSVLFAHAVCEHTTSTWVTVTEPDCKTHTDGYYECFCDDCGEKIDDDTTSWEYAHDFSKQTIVKYPTCTEKGEAKDICIHCGTEASYTVLFPNLHDGIRNEVQGNGTGYYDYSDDVIWYTDTPATCTQPGLKHGVCKDCGETVASEPIEPLGHKSEVYDDYLTSTDDAEYYIGCKNVTHKNPTCTEDGYISFNCDVCGEPVRVFEQEATGHYNESMDHYHTDWYLYDTNVYKNPPDVTIWTDEEDVDYIPETCTEPGKVIFKCHECQEVLETVVVTPKGHHNSALESWDELFATDPDFGTDEDLMEYVDWYNVDYVAPTCTKRGQVIFKCLDCQEVMRVMTVEELGHDEGTWTIDIEATADHNGWMSLRCNRCGELIKKKKFELHDHQFGEWYPNNDGTHSHICSTCAFADTAPCKYETTVTPPTCLEGGYTTYVCKDCGYTYVSDYTDPLGHDWSAWTDDGNGETHTRTCNRCGEKEVEDHCFCEWFYNHDAKFFKNGTKSRICDICGCVETEEAKHTAWFWHPIYPIILFLGSTTHKAIFVGSLYWLFPWLNLYPEM